MRTLRVYAYIAKILLLREHTPRMRTHTMPKHGSWVCTYHVYAHCQNTAPAYAHTTCVRTHCQNTAPACVRTTCVRTHWHCQNTAPACAHATCVRTSSMKYASHCARCKNAANTGHRGRQSTVVGVWPPEHGSGSVAASAR